MNISTSRARINYMMARTTNRSLAFARDRAKNLASLIIAADNLGTNLAGLAGMWLDMMDEQLREGTDERQ